MQIPKAPSGPRLRIRRPVLMCALWLCVAATSRADTYHDPIGHFTFQIPADWQQLTQEELEDLDGGESQSADTRPHEIAFRHRNASADCFPRVFVRFVSTRIGSISPKTVDRFAESFKKGLERQLDDGRSDWADRRGVDAITFDKSRNRFDFQGRNFLEEVGGVRFTGVVHVGGKGLVVVTGATEARHLERDLPVFNAIQESFRFEPGYSFTPRRRGMSDDDFAEHIGEIVGAVVGISIVALRFRKKKPQLSDAPSARGEHDLPLRG